MGNSAYPVHHLEPLPIGVAAVDEDGVEAGDARPALDRRNNRLLVSDPSAALDAADKFGADDALVHEAVAFVESSLRRPLRHPGRSAGAARRAVDGLVAVEHGIAAG